MLVIQHGECRLGQKSTHAHMTKREVMILTKPGVKFLLISVQANSLGRSYSIINRPFILLGLSKSNWKKMHANGYAENYPTTT